MSTLFDTRTLDDEGIAVHQRGVSLVAWVMRKSGNSFSSKTSTDERDRVIDDARVDSNLMKKLGFESLQLQDLKKLITLARKQTVCVTDGEECCDGALSFFGGSGEYPKNCCFVNFVGVV